MTITRKIKIGKIWRLVFLSIEPISNLPCKFQKFPPKKKIAILKNCKEKKIATFFCDYVVSELARFVRGRIEDWTLVSTGSRSTAFKEIFSGRLFPVGFLSEGFYPDTIENYASWKIHLFNYDIFTCIMSRMGLSILLEIHW